MLRFDIRNAAATAAALVVTIWSASMMIAATAIPAVSSISTAVA